MSNYGPPVVPDDDAPPFVPGDDEEPASVPGEGTQRSATTEDGESPHNHSEDGFGDGYKEGGAKYEDVPEPGGTHSGGGYKDVPEPEGDEADTRPMPEPVNAADWCADPPPQEPAVIEGLLRKKAKMVLGGCSKSRKSWTLIQLALSLASGLPFLGMPTRRSRVFYVNLELPEAEMCGRVVEVAKALGCDVDGLWVWNLRGHAQPLEDLVALIVLASRAYEIEVIILDPIYKVLGERSENSNEDVADLLNHVDEIAERAEAAFIFAHHFAKGSQGGKFVEDRISGAGAWWRDPDAGIFMTPLEDEGGFNITCMARSFLPRAEFAARASHPLIVQAEDLDPANIKKPGPSKKATTQQLVALLTAEGSIYSDWYAAAKAKFHVSESTFNRRKKEAETEGKIKQEGDRYFQNPS